jgi:hypothetical protein
METATKEPQTSTFSPQFIHVFTIEKSHFWLPNPRTRPPINQIESLKNHNSPQLTTKAEDWFYPQPTGPSSAIDF